MRRRSLVFIVALACALTGGVSWYGLGQTGWRGPHSEDELFVERVERIVEPSSTPTSLSNNYRVKVPFVGPRKEFQELEQTALRLTQEYASATDPEHQEDIKEELNKTVEKEFDARQEAREKELDELEKQLQRLREIHDRRERERGRIINDRVQQLLRDAEGLGWGSSAPSQGPSRPANTSVFPTPDRPLRPVRPMPDLNDGARDLRDDPSSGTENRSARQLLNAAESHIALGKLDQAKALLDEARSLDHDLGPSKRKSEVQESARVEARIDDLREELNTALGVE